MKRPYIVRPSRRVAGFCPTHCATFASAIQCKDDMEWQTLVRWNVFRRVSKEALIRISNNKIMASRILSLKNGFKAAQMLGGTIVCGIGVYENYWIVTDVDPGMAAYFASRHPWLSKLDLHPCTFVQSAQDPGAWELLQKYVSRPVEDTPGINGRRYLVGLASREFID